MRYHWPSPGQTQIMGILNTTPDSFSDGGQFMQADSVRARVEQMLGDGADIIDIGGESTRPGAQPVSVQQELDRIMPALEYALTAGATVSVDTSKAEVMVEVIKHGAHVINDVLALQAPGALAAIQQSEVAVCLMHMQGEPRTMQAAPSYEDVVAEVSSFLQQRVQACEHAGIARSRLCLDPGFGFGKTLAHNLRLLRKLTEFSQSDIPVLVGLSRKSMIDQLTNASVDDRLAGSVALALLAAQAGARIVRVHDVRETRQALKIWQALQEEN